MKDYTDEQILEKYNKLPKDVKEFVFSDEIAKDVNEIGKKHKLAIDKIGELNNETGMVILGAERASEFIKIIKERLQLSDEQARAIGKDINERVFNKVREVLKQSSQMRADFDKSALDRKKEQLKKEEEEREKSDHPPLTPPAPIDQSEKAVPPLPPNLPTEKSLNVTNDIVKDKLENQVRIPREEIDLNNDNSEQQEKKRPYSSDPYREPIE